MNKIKLFSRITLPFLIITFMECASFPPMSETGVAFVSTEVTPALEIVYQQPGEKTPQNADVVLTSDPSASEKKASDQSETVAVETVAGEPKSATGVVPFNG